MQPQKTQNGKAIVLGMRERSGKTKAINISEIDGNTLHKAIHDNVSHGSTTYTDELRDIGGLAVLPTNTSGVIHSAKRTCQWPNIQTA